ncbi:M60 family metallopeptidase [Chitinophaga sp.]|uniref:M60 family metallopeptidase n=1 Tax=Chitinophaga sp. TaxID=1869181 RepID=UPI0031DE8F72
MKNNSNYLALSIVLVVTSLIYSCSKPEPESLQGYQKPGPRTQSPNRSAITNAYYEVDSLGRSVQFVTESPSAESEKSRLMNSFIPSDFYPTGFWLAPFSTLKIEAEAVSGTSLPQLLIGTYQRYENVNPQVVQLKPGLNEIVANKNGGILWVRYHDDLEPVSKAKLTFISGHKAVPTFVKNTTTADQWLRQFEQADTAVHDVLLIGQRVCIVLPTSFTALKTQDNNSILNACDNIWDTEDKLSGLDGSQPVHKPLGTPHLMVNRNYAGGAAWPYATTYSYLSSFAAAYANDAWYQRHEAGHHHQQAWHWHAEILADFYATATGMDWKLPGKKITRDGGWLNVWKAVNEYFNLPDADRDYSKIWDGNRIASGHRFRGSAMLIQLKLAFGDTFYHELHKRTRSERPSLPTAASKYRYFMLKACNISGKDLTGFFRKWGFKDEAVYTEIARLNLPQPDVDPSTMTDDPTFTLN